MAEEEGLWVVLVGPHCAGKTTIGQELASRLAWTFDGEIGEDVMEKTPRTSSDHEIFDRERERDRERAATCRVVETWHPGNLAWAEWRGSDDEVLAAEMREAMRTRDLSVVVIALRCGDDERRQRRLATGRERLPSQEDENDDDAMFVETGRIGARAEAIAREELKREQLRVVWTDRRSVSEVVDEIQAHLLEMVLPEPKVAEVPELCVDLESALKVFKAAAKVLPELASRLAKVALPEPLAQQSYPGVTVTVDGLDGCGKSTLVKRLRRVLGSSAIHARSPPRRLDDLRRFVETAVEGHKNPYFQNSEAVARLSRSFYFLGNYALADDLLEVNDPAVVDRFASSTLAYTLGSADATQAAQYAWLVPGCFGEYVLPFFVVPVKGEWPRDLPTADVALVLDADESIRRERIDKRSAGKNVGVGYWERATFVDPFLGPAIARRFFNSAAACPEKKTAVVDANGAEEEVFRRAALELVDRGVAVVFRDVVDADDCETILEILDQARLNELPKEDLENRYKWKQTNTVYPTSGAHHHQMDVTFLRNEGINAKINHVADTLARETGRKGWRVQEDTLPVFTYADGGFVSPHRDVDLTSLRDYAAVVMLARQKHDFTDGALFVNAHADFDHKNLQNLVESEVITKRQYFRDLDQGDVVVFRNANTIHGVSKVAVKPGSRGRITASWRI